MKLLQIGAPKSGNIWLYKILKEILDRNGQRALSFIEQQPNCDLAKSWDLNYPKQGQIDMIDFSDLQTSYRISSIYRMPIEHMADYVSQTDQVWSHSPF